MTVTLDDLDIWNKGKLNVISKAILLIDLGPIFANNNRDWLLIRI